MRSSAKFRPQMVQRSSPSGTDSSWKDRFEAADVVDTTDDAADGFRLGLARGLPVEVRDAEDLAEFVDEWPPDDCAGAGAAGAEDELAIAGDFLGTDFVALLLAFAVTVGVVVDVLPGTGFSLRLLTFCWWPLSFPTFGSFRGMGVGVSVMSSSNEIVSGNFSSSNRFSLSSKDAAFKVSTWFPFSGCGGRCCCIARRAFVLAEIGGTRVLLFRPAAGPLVGLPLETLLPLTTGFPAGCSCCCCCWIGCRG